MSEKPMPTCRKHGLKLDVCDDPGCFEEAGGAHGGVPFDGPHEAQLRRIATALEGINIGIRALAILVRGRDDEGKRVSSTLSAIADAAIALAKRQPEQPAAPATQRTPQSATAQGGKRVATDAEMSGEKGDPKVRFDPKKDWTDKGKPSFKGQNFSACDPDFLDVYAAALDYFATEAQKKVDAGAADDRAKKEAQYGPLDAARARGWAARIRANGYKPQPAPATPPAYI